MFEETSGDRGIGEKMARSPEESLTTVDRPPNLNFPKRRKGTEKVVTEGATLRITSAGLGAAMMVVGGVLEEEEGFDWKW